MRNDSSHFAVQIELLGPSLKNFFLLLKKINFNEYEFIWQTQFRQYGCYLVPKITTASQQQTMNEGTITAQSHRTQGQRKKKIKKRQVWFSKTVKWGRLVREQRAFHPWVDPKATTLWDHKRHTLLYIIFPRIGEGCDNLGEIFFANTSFNKLWHLKEQANHQQSRN